MSRSIELLVTDLDGTVWHRPDEVPAVTRAALHRVVDDGPSLLVATGRRASSTRVPLAALDLAPPAVVLNGALGLDLATGERFHEGGFTDGSAAAVLAVFAAHDVRPCVYVDHDVHPVRVGEGPSTHPDHVVSLGDELLVCDLDEVVVDHHVLAFGVLGIDEGLARRLGDELARIAVPHVDADRQYTGWSVTCSPMDRSKWDGIEAWARRLGVDAEAVLVIGDGPNDVEMLDRAGVAVVPSDAHPAALALADHVVAPAAAGGWAELLDLLDL